MSVLLTRSELATRQNATGGNTQGNTRNMYNRGLNMYNRGLNMYNREPLRVR
jgi:hypothetical protein